MTHAPETCTIFLIPVSGTIFLDVCHGHKGLQLKVLHANNGGYDLPPQSTCWISLRRVCRIVQRLNVNPITTPDKYNACYRLFQCTRRRPDLSESFNKYGTKGATGNKYLQAAQSKHLKDTAKMFIPVSGVMSQRQKATTSSRVHPYKFSRKTCCVKHSTILLLFSETT